MRSVKLVGTFALCLRNHGSEDLEPRKVYRVLPDRDAGREGYVRVIDESGEDYLYPAEYFASVKLPAGVAVEVAWPGETPEPAVAKPRHR